MSCVNVVPSLQVSAFETTVEWYERLFGRAPDRRPMDGCVEWQLAPTGGPADLSEPRPTRGCDIHHRVG